MDFISLGNIKTKIKRIQLDQWLTIILGSLIISGWTLIRFFNQIPNFDKFGQQVLAHQWLQGLHSGSVIGPTNYVLKMLFIYIPFDQVPLPGQLKLVLMTLLINIVTFVLLLYILKRLWSEFYPNHQESIHLPMIYLALISGSVYWISFANSRNLEVVGGLFLLYLYVRHQPLPSLNYYGRLILLGSLLFFADPLQIYMTLLPALIFVGMRCLAKRDRQQLIILIKLLGCAAISITLAHFLRLLVEDIWNVYFIKNKQSLDLSLSSFKLAASQMARLYAGGFEGGRAREAIDLLVVAGAAAGALYYAWRKPRARRLVALAAIVWTVDLGVFIISGQARQTDTNRYLIMTVPMFVLITAMLLYYLRLIKVRTYFLAGLIIFNTVTLGRAFVKDWNPHFSNNNHDRSVTEYFKSHKYTYGYASIGTALSSDYLSNWQVNLLPIGCEPDYSLKKANLFFDKAAFKVAQGTDPNTLVPIILDGDNIMINRSACGDNQIEQQLGQRQRTDRLSDGSTVLLYKADQLHKLLPVTK